MTETFVFRCTATEKAELRAKAEAAGLPAATLLREALSLGVDAKELKVGENVLVPANAVESVSGKA